MAITLGGHGSAVPADGSSRTSSNFTVAPTVGSTVSVAVNWSPDTTHTVSSVTDSAGNTYVAAGSAFNLNVGGNRISVQIWYAKNVATATPFAVTANMSGSCFDIGVSAAEWKAADTTAPKDLYNGQTQENPGTGADAVTTPALGTPSTDGQVVFAFTGNKENANISAGTGYTQLHNQGGAGAGRFLSEYLIQTTAAPVTATWTTTSTTADFASVAVTFKPLIEAPDLDLQPSGVEATAELGTPELGIVQPGYLVISRSSS